MLAKHVNVYVYNFRMAKDVFFRKPLFFLRVVKNYTLALLPLKTKPLRFADISITHSCNFNCIHCSEQSLERNTGRPLSIEEYKHLARQLIDEGILNFHFTGGEPFLRKDMEEIIRVFQPERCMVSVQTNGSLITKERLKTLKAAGLDMVCISIDGDESAHDTFRQIPGSHEQCWKSVKMVIASGLRVAVCTTVGHNNIRSPMLEQLILEAKALGANCLLNIPVPIGRYKNNIEVLFDKEDREYMEGLMRKYPHCRTDFESNYYIHGCGALKEKIYLTPEGNVIPCPFIHIVCGNVRSKPIRDIRLDGLNKIPELRDYQHVCPAAEDREFQKKYSYFTDSVVGADVDTN